MTNSEPIKVLVCGGRDYQDSEYLNYMMDIVLNMCKGNLCVIHGGAKGADSLAAEWCKTNNVPSIAVCADWETHGKAAGPIRNQLMLEMQPKCVIAFPGGRGTADMIRRAQVAGVSVIKPTRPNKETNDD